MIMVDCAQGGMFKGKTCFSFTWISQFAPALRQTNIFAGLPGSVGSVLLQVVREGIDLRFVLDFFFLFCCVKVLDFETVN